jgi:hypothetical protein
LLIKKKILKKKKNFLRWLKEKIKIIKSQKKSTKLNKIPMIKSLESKVTKKKIINIKQNFLFYLLFNEILKIK